MGWKRLFEREPATQTKSGTEEREGHTTQVVVDPRAFLNLHRSRIDALRLECGYDGDQFERHIGAVLLRAAEWVHFLPATRVENHRESGGLLRLAVESACLAYRRADGKFLSGSTAVDIHSRERERIWRYVTFLGGLFRPLGRCFTHVKVCSSDSKLLWNPLQEGLWHWQRRIETNRVDIQWRAGIDGRPTVAATSWIAGRVVPASAISYLQAADSSLPEIFLRVLSGESEGRLGEIVEESYQAAIDLDIGRLASAEEQVNPGVPIEHRLLESLRGLCRDKWTMNTAGGRLWYTDSGVYIVWKPAANDLIVRMRAHGTNDAPRDPEALAQLLLSHGVLVRNPNSLTALTHYYRLIPQMRGVPKQPLEVVKVADAELLGLQLQGVDRVPAELIETAQRGRASTGSNESEPKTLELPLEDKASMTPSAVADTTLEPVAETDARSSVAAPTAAMDRLKRFGPPGMMLQKLALRMAAEPGERNVVRVADGAAIAFPEAIIAIGEEPQAFLSTCEAQGLLIADRAGGRQFVRSRGPAEEHLPAQYVILAARVARHLRAVSGELM